jgi:hypothetical protein
MTKEIKSRLETYLRDQLPAQNFEALVAEIAIFFFARMHNGESECSSSGLGREGVNRASAGVGAGGGGVAGPGELG